jgi:beta-aspartyl-peptidase (threonine type)
MTKPILMIHGGAWAMPDEGIAAHENGIQKALAVGYAVLERGGRPATDGCSWTPC